MAMGNTGTVNVTPEMINNAKDAIQEYKDTVKTLYSQLEDTMSALFRPAYLKPLSGHYTSVPA